MMDCIFCKIVAGTLPAKIIYQDKEIIAFDDIYPKAPQHKLIIPRKHIATINDLSPEDESLVGRMILVAKKLATELEIAQSGYRISINCNKDGGQVVYHLHLHLMGGRSLQW
ncbi:MAG: histidine triad nucleotide-binding protein [bacterium]